MLGLGQIRMGAGGGASGALRPQDAFSTTLYAGNGATQAITTGIDLVGLGDGTKLQGGLVWIKNRSSAVSHVLQDTVRGGFNLATDTAATQSSSTSPEPSSSGFNLTTSVTTLNGPVGTYASWTFRRTVKFFDIVQYTGNGVAGRQISHSLGVAPGMVIIKALNLAATWAVYHRSTGSAQYLTLSATSAAASDSGQYWSNTTPTNLVVTLGSSSVVNTSGVNYIAYLFAHDPDTTNGIVQCGSYLGNGSATGPVVTLGWEPQYLLVKNSSATGGWTVVDAARGLTSGTDPYLYANTTGAEATSTNIANPLTTGFQMASTGSDINTSGATYIYLAIRKATP